MIIEDNKIRSSSNEVVAHVDNDTNRFIIDRGRVGSVVQSVSAQYTANSVLSNLIPYDDTIPQNTEGTQILTASITLQGENNRVRARFAGWGACNTTDADIISAIFRGSGVNAIATTVFFSDRANGRIPLAVEVEDAPNLPKGAVVTYSVRVGPSGGTLTVNGVLGARLFGGSAKAILILEEIQA